MIYNFVSNIKTCEGSIFEMLNGGDLGILYYSHIPVIVISLLLGIFVLLKSRDKLLGRVLFALAFAFSVWSILDLITWISYSSTNIMIAWSLLGIFDVLFFILSLYFVYVFIDKKDISFVKKIILSTLALPILVMTPTRFNLNGFIFSDCAADDKYFLNYIYFVEIIIFTWLIFLLINRFIKANKIDRNKILLLSVGVLLFLLSFFSMGYLADYLTNLNLISGYGIEIYGLFGMVFFIGFLAFLIVKFKAFNIKLVGAQALVWALVIFIGSQFLYMDKMPMSSLIITGITLVLSAVIGLMIVRGIKKEIAIREKIEVLADQLEHTNERLRVLDQQKTQFVSLASHQLRAPLTSIKGYLSMILEGDYGPVEGEQREMIQRVLTSSNNLVTIVGDFLDVSRIEQNKMSYEWADFDLKPLVETVYHEQESGAGKKGLKLNLDIEEHIEYKLHGDMNKLKQVFTNLTDNSIKYTPKGEVSISLSRPSPKIIRFEIKDTGIGISATTLPKLFDKFVRADGANEVNVIGTGLGLFVAKEMVKAHEGGKIWAESEGLGKGSRFVVELKAL
jgi:signal transduction histidine kinase